MNIVYKIVNTVNGRVYIGSSTNGKYRITGHKSCLRKNSHPNKLLQEDYNMFGELSFEFVIIKTIDDINLSTLKEEEEKALLEYSERTEVYNKYFNCGSIYPNIKKHKLSHKEIAKAFGFNTVRSFETSSAHKRYMGGINEVLNYV